MTMKTVSQNEKCQRQALGSHWHKIATPNETAAKRQLTQCFYAKRHTVPTPNDAEFMRQMKQENLSQPPEIIAYFAPVLCALLPQYWRNGEKILWEAQ